MLRGLRCGSFGSKINKNKSLNTLEAWYLNVVVFDGMAEIIYSYPNTKLFNVENRIVFFVDFSV